MSALEKIAGEAVLWRRDLHRRGVRLAFTDVQSDVATLMTRAGLTQSVGAEMFFDDLDDAVIAFDSKPPI